MKILPVILSGGFGARLWPISSKYSPKQFLKLADGSSLFGKALSLVQGEEFFPPIIVSNEAHKNFILEEIKHYSAIILEHISKNTANSIALALIKAKELYGEDTNLLVIPSDHLISNKNLFLKSVNNALKINQNITLFGVKPTRPETGYGYIEIEDTKVKSFKEKPNKETAEKLLLKGNFMWNSGIFMLKLSNSLKSFLELSPNIYEICQNSLKMAQKDNKIFTLNEEEFSKTDDISFDYAIVEKSKDITFTPMLSPWADVGDLNSFAKNFNKEVKIESIQSSNFTVISNKLVALIGIENTTIVDTENALLIAKNEHLQDVKRLVKSLENKNANEIINQTKKLVVEKNTSINLNGKEFILNAGDIIHITSK